MKKLILGILIALLFVFTAVAQAELVSRNVTISESYRDGKLYSRNTNTREQHKNRDFRTNINSHTSETNNGTTKRVTTRVNGPNYSHTVTVNTDRNGKKTKTSNGRKTILIGGKRVVITERNGKITADLPSISLGSIKF